MFIGFRSTAQKLHKADMDRDSVPFLKKQFKHLFNSFFGEAYDFENYNYIIDFDPTEKWLIEFGVARQMSRGRFKLNNNLNFDDTCEMLVQSGNTVPLWIKMSLVEDSRTVKLIVSKRFRKKKVIEQWHKDNEFRPIIYMGCAS